MEHLLGGPFQIHPTRSVWPRFPALDGAQGYVSSPAARVALRRIGIPKKVTSTTSPKAT